MYLANMKLWNFRKFGSREDFDLTKPDLDLNFTEGLNVLIGENDSGKSTIIDAIKLVLRTHSYEWIRVVDEDFYFGSTRFRIELRFEGFENNGNEAKHFVEWLGWYEKEIVKEKEKKIIPFLKLSYDVTRTEERILPADVKAGVDDEGRSLNAEAREYLKVTYLKPLRDAHAELVPKRNSRLSQIFQEHSAFKNQNEQHILIEYFRRFNKEIESYFDGYDIDHNQLSDQHGKELKEKIDDYIHDFYGQGNDTKLTVAKENLKKILEALELSMDGIENPGLGTLNRLFMASELVHLSKENWDGLRLGLIEELEAHLHPQAQMQIIEALQKIDGIQLILTTHSPNLASKIKLKNIIICNNDYAFPMGSDFTKLDEKDYVFLEHFLDVTKANLFFAKGVIFVEGWAEEIFLPSFIKRMKKDELIQRDLTESGVSVVNIGNTGFSHFSKIFLRETEPYMNIPVAIITDVDAKVYKYKKKKLVRLDQEEIAKEIKEKINSVDKSDVSDMVRTFISPQWTFEYCLYKSNIFSKKFQEITKDIHSKSDFANFEEELAKKLLKRSLNKTGIAYKLALFLDQASKEEINISQYEDDTIRYIVEAVKHVCRY